MSYNRKNWTEEEIEYLKEHYPMTSATDLADVFHCSSTTVSNKAKALGLKKSPDFDTHKYIGRYVKRGIRYLSV